MPTYKNPIPTVDLTEGHKSEEIEVDINDYILKKSVYFAFIDVLGFKRAFYDNRIVKTTDCSDKYRKVFTYYFELMSIANFSKKPLYYAGQTSDSLYFYTERPDILVEFLKIFSHFSLYAMTQDVFFRGGIANGNLFFNEDYQFYGESVINAYLMESEISKNPIIMIDENTFKAISIDTEFTDTIISKNGRHFLGPFAYLEHSFNLGIDTSINNIKQIKEEEVLNIIEQNKNKFEYDARNYEKYSFLLKEYDEYIKRIKSKIGGEKND